MISICIPIFNFNVTPLVKALTDQAAAAEVPVEILLIDDASKNTFKALNRSVCQTHHYIELEQNIGRAKIRNLFLQYAQYNYLLFLDCDSLIISPNFLSNYIVALNAQPSVVCGGRIYDANRPIRKYQLRWKYGKYRESLPVTTRALQPNKSFMTNNFVIQKSILDKIKFDERLTQYGHEDTLFGYALKKEKITISHIENAVLNGDVENNLVFLQKTDEGLKNLAMIIHFYKMDPKLMSDIALLRAYQKLYAIKWLVYLGFVIIKPILVLLLKSGYINLYLFDMYKLGRLFQYSRELKA